MLETSPLLSFWINVSVDVIQIVLCVNNNVAVKYVT